MRQWNKLSLRLVVQISSFIIKQIVRFITTSKAA
jgi:hypothetical protein